MSGPSKQAEEFRLLVKAEAEKRGIETILLVFQDPDSHIVCGASKGNRLWLIGALTDERHTLLSESGSEEIEWA